MTKKIFSVFLFILFFCPGGVFAFKGIVLGVKNGDTLIVKRYGRQVMVRLYGVDAPEKGQAFFDKVCSYTGKFKGKTVDVVEEGLQVGNKVEGFVYSDGKSVNEDLVKSGLAWIDPSKCKHPKCKNWEDYQNLSKKDGKGLWSEKNPVPPWQFRALKK